MEDPTIITLGCRMNAVESETVRAHARAAGLSDCVVINTCAVTAEAMRQAQQTVRRLRRERPHARLIVTGCGAQLEPERFRAMPEVDAVIGNGEKLERRTYDDLRRRNDAHVAVGDIMIDRRIKLPPIEARAPGQAQSGRSRAFVAVQNGCDHRCTFCIIPFARGPSRSVPVADVVRHATALVANGYREVVLTGVDLTSYGTDLDAPSSLGELVATLLDRVPTLRRLRLSSIDPAETDPVLEAAMRTEPRLMPHLHLSLQSGDDLVLKRMKRRHTSRDAANFVERMRAARSELMVGADVIAGFPTETSAMFERTASVLEKLDIAYLHVFPFSPRAGTPAARMPPVSGPEIKHRADTLREAAAARLSRLLDQRIGKEAEILMEASGRGRLPEFIEVEPEFGAGATQPGQFMRVKIIRHDGRRMTGEVVA